MAKMLNEKLKERKAFHVGGEFFIKEREREKIVCHQQKRERENDEILKERRKEMSRMLLSSSAVNDFFCSLFEIAFSPL